MPITFDLISRLAIPQIAVLVAILIVALSSGTFYFLPRVLQKRTRETYLQRVQLIAEILVSVGLIGLVSFVGRAKLESDAIELKETVLQRERDVAAAFYPYAVSECITSSQLQRGAPTASAIAEVCRIWKDFNYVHDNRLPWREASRELEYWSAQGEVLPLHRKNIRTIYSAINRMQDVRDEVALVPLKRDILTKQISLPFLLMCAFSACVGVGAKCARAALQLWPGPLSARLPP